MAESNPKVQRSSFPMLLGVVDEAEVARLEGLINDIRTIVELVRADVVPISEAALNSNPQFILLLNKMDSFQQMYGVQVKDMDFNLNPIFSDLESRVDVIENAIIELRTNYQVLTDQQNAFHERLRAIEEQLGLVEPEEPEIP